jgi:hypothetical protein
VPFLGSPAVPPSVAASSPSISAHGRERLSGRVDRRAKHAFVRCEFCGSLRPRWSYPVGSGSRRACDDCRQAIEANDREALLKRALLIPIPRTVPDRYGPRFRERARQLHVEFWKQRPGLECPSASTSAMASRAQAHSQEAPALQLPPLAGLRWRRCPWNRFDITHRPRQLEPRPVWAVVASHSQEQKLEPFTTPAPSRPKPTQLTERQRTVASSLSSPPEASKTAVWTCRTVSGAVARCARSAASITRSRPSPALPRPP